MIRRLATVTALMAVVTGAPLQPLSCESVPGAAGDDPVAEAIAASKAIITAFGRDEPNTYFALFDSAATFIFYTSPECLESRAAYEAEWATWRRDLGFRVRSCASSDQHVQVLDDVAILTHFVRTDITTIQKRHDALRTGDDCFPSQTGEVDCRS